jgi:hypothetical protein
MPLFTFLPEDLKVGLVAFIPDHKEIMELLDSPPLIVNDLKLDFGTKEGKDRLAMYLSYQFDGDSIPTVPTCLGGHIGGEAILGEMCPTCSTRVTNLVDRAVETGVWIAPPTGVNGFIHPEIWNILSPRLTPLKSFSMMSWVCDPNYSETLPAYAAILEEYKRVHKRGLNYVLENFDDVIHFIMSSKLCNKLSLQDKADIQLFLIQNRDKVVQQYLPLPSAIFVVSEKTAMGTYADEKTTALLDAVYMVTSTYGSPIALTQRQRESHAARFISSVGSCYQNICTKFIGGKYGLVRRQQIGSRLHFSGRAVITSLSDSHHYEELHVPWAFAVQIMEPHLCAKLTRRGFSVDEAYAFLEDHTLNWNPLLRELFDELIAESPPLEGFPEGIFQDLDEDPTLLRGIPCILQRNPSLTRGSAQCLRITTIKDDIDDFTISLSNMILVAYNADFDGDELNLLLCLDKKMLKAFGRLRPHLGMRSLREPRTLSDNQKIHAPVAATWAHYVHHSEHTTH